MCEEGKMEMGEEEWKMFPVLDNTIQSKIECKLKVDYRHTSLQD